MYSWQKTWREGIAPCLTDDQLEALRDALECDDRRLIQGATTSPPPMTCCSDWICEAACAIGFCALTETSTVNEVENWFANLCYKADKLLGQPGAIRYFLNYWDETPRERARRELMEEIDFTFKERQKAYELTTGQTVA